ncbi:MAG TPA: hypothetical protein VMH35_11615 [Streptosporangiaceae bacterium]|nr:hypothetical protein [Streptosporangiaceae bacterium]
MLRHLIGLGLATGLAVMIFFAGGWGVARMSALAAQGTSVTSITGLSALGVLLLAGLYLGVLLVAPVSPVSTALPGLGLLVWTGLLGLDAHLAARGIPAGAGMAASGFRQMLADGVLALLGVVMICPAFVPSRWRPASAADLGLDHGSGGGDEAPGLPAPTRLLS